MLIAQNPIIRAVAVVVAFWYVVLLLFSYGVGVTFWSALYAFPQSLLIAVAGLGVAVFFSVLLRKAGTQAEGAAVREGQQENGASILLGNFPYRPVVPQAKTHDALLEEQSWWSLVCAQAPAYAPAFRAAMRTMAAEPKLPASPYPGGHGGRTLIEHSLAVASHILDESSRWEYTGQRDKRGNIRVRPQGDAPHRFTGKDAPLLLLTAFVHDIGKVTCYAPDADAIAAQERGAKTIPVIEVRRNHDHEGAKLLRKLPEVMALPLVDRNALLLAVGYYHHPFALPSSGWLTDRMRSLTELLAKADQAVGESEGNTLVDYGDFDADDGGEPTHATPTETVMNDAAEDAALAAVAASVRAAKAPKPPTLPASPSDKPPVPASAEDKALPRELRLFMSKLMEPGSINGSREQARQSFARKSGETIAVMDGHMRRILQSSKEVRAIEDYDWIGKAFAEDSNGALFTLNLLDQLAERGMLITEADGLTYSPRRALFYTKKPDGTKGSVVFLLRVSAIPGAASIPSVPEWPIFGPLFGRHQGRAKAAPAPETPAPESPSTDDSAPKASTVDAVAAAASPFADSDLPFAGMLTEDAQGVDANAPAAVPATVPPPEPEASSAPVPPRDISVELSAAILADTDGIFEYRRVTRADGDYLLVRIDSPTGEAVRTMADDLTAEAVAQGDAALPLRTAQTEAHGLEYILRVAPSAA